MDAIERMRSLVRTVVRQFARALNTVSRGFITPNMVTMTGLLLHAVIVWLIISDLWLIAALALVIFGLMDTLDGELARLQKRTSLFGMVLDATTDRMKEGMLLGALGFWFAREDQLNRLTLVLAVLILSFTISYIKAKAETVVAAKIGDANQTNRHYQDGLARFEVRMVLLVAGLATGQVSAVLWLLLVLNTWTVVERSLRISRDLKT